MKYTDPDTLIDRIHAANAMQRQQEVYSKCSTPASHIDTRIALAAAVAALLLASVALLWPESHPVRPILTASEPASPKPAATEEPRPAMPAAAEPTYAWFESKDGLLVYCEDHCNPDEVVERLNQVIQSLD